MAILKKSSEEKQEKASKVARTESPLVAHVINDVLLRPRLTEKAYLSNEKNQYVFQIAKNATKHAVKAAVEQAYGVKVEMVRTIVIPPKKRNFGRYTGMKSGIKKAMVTIASGQTLPLFKTGE